MGVEIKKGPPILRLLHFYSGSQRKFYEKCHFRKIGGHFFISTPIFNIKKSMKRSHKCGFITAILLKIDGVLLEKLMKNHFVQNKFSLISRERFHQFSRE